jgi:kynurenine 3-monooxygenase
MKPDTITLVGGGMSGPVMAMYLAKRGHQVNVFERRPDMRATTTPAGRSINLALSKRGIVALKDIDVFSKISSRLIPMYGRQIHNLDRSTRLLKYGKSNQFINSVSRAELNKILITEAEKTGRIQFYFNYVCTGVNCDTNAVFFENKKSGETVTIENTPVIAADGSGSEIRKSLSETGNISSQLEPLGHSYKELTIPPDEFGTFQLDANALHIWPRGDFMLIALPNMDNSFTVTLFLPNIGKTSFDSIQSKRDLSELFQANFPDVKKMIPDLEHDFFTNPTGKLATVRCASWNVNQIVLIGDAAHAVVPFFGQGMNASFEDCIILDSMMDSHKDWSQLFESFSNHRKKDGDAIADMALENYIEMRDSVNKESFRLQRNLEKELENTFPNQFISRYSMVSFHQIPYSSVQKRGAFQQKLMIDIMNGIESNNPLTVSEIENSVNTHLSILK